MTPSASFRASPAGTMIPPPSGMASGNPPASVTTAGLPSAIASIRAIDNPSITEESTNTSKQLAIRGSVGARRP